MKIMLNIDFFKKIRFNRCEITLNESESYYLYSKFHNLILLSESKKNIFSKKNIKIILKDFCNISETRYFGLNDIDYISNYYSQMLKEARSQSTVARGLESSINKQVDPEHIIKHYEGSIVDDAAAAYKGRSTNTTNAVDSVAFVKKGVEIASVEVENPDDAHVYLKKVEQKVINKI